MRKELICSKFWRKYNSLHICTVSRKSSKHFPFRGNFRGHPLTLSVFHDICAKIILGKQQIVSSCRWHLLLSYTTHIFPEPLLKIFLLILCENKHFCENLGDNKYFRENLPKYHGIKCFLKNMFLFSHVADKFWLSCKNLRRSKHFYMVAKFFLQYFSQRFSREWKNVFVSTLNGRNIKEPGFCGTVNSTILNSCASLSPQLGRLYPGYTSQFCTSNLHHIVKGISSHPNIRVYSKSSWSFALVPHC